MATLKEKAKTAGKKISDKATAEAVEAKKTLRKAARDTKAAAGKAAKTVSAKARKAADDAAEVTAAVGAEISDLAVANEIEAKKGAAKAKRTVKKKLEEAVAPVAEKIDEVKLADQMARGRKKAQGDRKKAETRAKAESVKDAVKTPGRKVAAAKLKINIQSPMGGVITPEEIAAKVPKGAKEVYIRVDENRIYWVGPKDSGSVEIWE